MDAVCVTEKVCDAKMQAFSESIKRHEEGLERQTEKTSDIRELIVEMAEINKRHDSEIDNHGKRLAELESKPSKRWETIVEAVLRWGIVAALVALLAIK